MKRRRIVLAAAGILVGVVVGFMVWPGEREPEYQGKKLSEWATMRTDDLEGRNIVGHFGTNALPWLVKWLGFESLPPWRIKILDQVRKFPATLGGNYARKSLTGYERLQRSNFAQLSFHMLGQDARPAIPDLVRLACDLNRPKGGRAAATILSRFGTEVVPGLLVVLRKPQAPGRRPAIDYFRTHADGLGTNKTAAAEALSLCLADNDWRTRSDAALALCNLPVTPALVVPALAKSVTDTVAVVRVCSLQALAEFGESARSAMPALVRALKDSDPDVRMMARFALDQIAPEAKPTDAVNEL